MTRNDHLHMKLYTRCSKCRHEINFSARVSDRFGLAAKMGEKVELKCTSCTTLGKYHVSDIKAELQKDQVQLFQNRPNPFEQRTNIQFYLPSSRMVQLSIRNTLGEVIWSKQAYYNAGMQEEDLILDLPSGLYFYSLLSEEVRLTKSMLIQK